MNTTSRPRRRAALAVALFSLFLLPCSLFPQGTLTPPGAPAPTMKTLVEVEPRIAVQTLAGDATTQFLVTQPGSYYLTGNINGVSGKVAIAIIADNVSLDLGGHSLIGVVGATRGVEIRGARNQIVVRNGSIRSFDIAGITTTTSVANARVERITVTGIVNGVGISLFGESNLVRDCNLTSIGGNGISLTNGSGATSQIESCVVTGCLAAGSVMGIRASSVIGCTANSIVSSGSTAFGISGSIVSTSQVTTVSSPTLSMGILGITATACRASSIGNAAGDTGSATGLSGQSVSACSAMNVGGAASTTAPVGITSNTATNCDVSAIGSVSSAVGATGINADTVTMCRVSIVRGGSSGGLTGITANVVADCNVENLSQGGSTGNVSGIIAENVSNCRLEAITGATTGSVIAIGNFILVRDCTVNNVTNSAGSAFGVNKSSAAAGSIESSVFRSIGTTGISVISRQRIVGCNITTLANGTGIAATGTQNVIDGNNIDGGGGTSVGISASNGSITANALIIRNQVRNCSTNIAFDPPCQVGPIITATSFITSTNPWANFTD